VECSGRPDLLLLRHNRCLCFRVLGQEETPEREEEKVASCRASVAPTRVNLSTRRGLASGPSTDANGLCDADGLFSTCLIVPIRWGTDSSFLRHAHGLRSKRELHSTAHGAANGTNLLHVSCN